MRDGATAIPRRGPLGQILGSPAQVTCSGELTLFCQFGRGIPATNASIRQEMDGGKADVFRTVSSGDVKRWQVPPVNFVRFAPPNDPEAL